MIYRYNVKDDSAYTIPGGTRLVHIQIEILESSDEENLELIVFLLSSNKCVYYATKLNKANNFSAYPNFFVPPDRDSLLNIVAKSGQSIDFKGHLLIELA